MHSTVRAEQNFDFNRLYPWVVLIPLVIVLPLFFLIQTIHSTDWAMALVAFFVFDNLGVQIGVHKLLAHRSFSTHPWPMRLLAFLAVFSGQGSPLVWVAVHMGNHHPGYETDKDLHSPKQGWRYAFLSWYWRVDTSKINFRLARVYVGDPILVFIPRHHGLLLVTYWLVLSLLSLKALVFLGMLPALVSIVLAGLVNANLHGKKRIVELPLLKYQNHPGDSTYNSVLLGSCTMGLGLHNNHHADPTAPYNNQRWFEIDLSRFIIPLIRK